MSTTKYQRDIAKWRKRKAEMAKLRRERFTLAEIGKMYRSTKQRVSQILGGSK